MVQATFAATLVDEWCRAGLTDAVVAPGSRSTPLALALGRRDGLRVHVRVDERSAAFFALGRALSTRRPVLMLVTSGTAGAELHAAVAEADQAGVPLIVVTADRPPELHHVGAPQTMEQSHLYGHQVRHYEEPGVARWEARGTWRDLASRLYRLAGGVASWPGPVHLNAAFVEPLVASPTGLPEAREGAWTSQETSQVTRSPLEAPERGLCVVGAGVDAPLIEELRRGGWVVLGDATALGTTPHFDALLRDEAFAVAMRPDVVVRLGGLPASKVLGQRLVQWDAPVVAYEGAGPVADPDRLIARSRPGLPAPVAAPESSYARSWRLAADGLERWLAEHVDPGELDEPSVARAVVAASTRHGVALVVGSSMPVRDVEWWAPSRRAPTYANRGVNGIDGVTSTILGVGAGGRVIGLVGDVTFLHDVSGLVDGLGDAAGSAVIVVSDNRGGGIFNFLAQAEEPAELFERFFATPRAHDLVVVAQAFGHDAQRVYSRAELDRAIDTGLARVGLSVVVVAAPSRERNVSRHAELNAQASQIARGE